MPRPPPSPEHPQGLCLDKGYDFAEVRRIVDEFGFTAHIRSRGEEAQAIKTGGRLQSPALGGGTHPQLDEPLPAHFGPLGQVSRQLYRLSAFRLCPYRSQSRRVIRIGSKYGTAFSGVATSRDEGSKVIDTLEGQNTRLSEDSKRVMQKIEAFRQQQSDGNRIVLVFATTEPISEQDRRDLEDIKIIGRERISDKFDVEEVSLMTIWEAIVEEQSQSLSVNVKGQFVDQDAGLLVGMVSLIDLFKFLVEYKNKAGNLDQLYEKNVRQFLGSRRKVNKGIVSTLNDNPQSFGLYNNGITIVASNYVKSDSDSTVEIRDPYVVNGCQTTRSIWQVLDGKLNSDGSARSDALNEWREGVERGGVIAKIVKSGEANILGSVDI